MITAVSSTKVAVIGNIKKMPILRQTCSTTYSVVVEGTIASLESEVQAWIALRIEAIGVKLGNKLVAHSMGLKSPATKPADI